MKIIDKKFCKIILRHIGESEKSINSMLELFDEGWLIKCRYRKILKRAFFICTRGRKTLKISFKF